MTTTTLKKTTGRRIKLKLTKKQKQAWRELNSVDVEQVLFGGGAGGGKTRLGCAFIILMSLKYVGIRSLIGRAVLKNLKQSTLLTFWEVCQTFGLKKGRDYTYNSSEGLITFLQTGSAVYLKDLAYNPSDPEYDDLGSTEYTFAFVDEASQITEKCRNVILSRLRFKIDEYGITPKLLMTCNPTKNFLYVEFYKPNKEGKLSKDKRFIQALHADNPFLSKRYIKILFSLDKMSVERLAKGNWEYDDDPTCLMDYDSIVDLFTNVLDMSKVRDDDKYIVADIARLGGDKTVIGVFHGLKLIEVVWYTKQDTTYTKNEIKKLKDKHRVPLSHIIVDEDGVGGGVKDALGCNGFVANSTALNGENYVNLKAQVHFKLADVVVNHLMAICDVSPEVKRWIIEELEQVKQRDADKDGKLAIVRKEDVKKLISRSPDFSDMLAMRMWFILKKKVVIATSNPQL